jgi:predicted O-methyltransferase YrrM
MASDVRHLSLVGPEPMPHFYESVPGFFHFMEAYRRLVETLPKDRPSSWVEIGSFQGRSLAWLGVTILNRRLATTLHAVDSFEAWPDVPQGADLRAIFEHNIAPISSIVHLWPMRSTEAAVNFSDESVDVVFVDGDHRYEAVKADILAWWPKLRRGGFMGGDDFMMRPVMRAVCEQFAPSGYILTHGWTELPEPQCWPSWTARKA